MAQPENFEVGVSAEAQKGIPLDPTVPAQVQFQQVSTAQRHYRQVFLDRTVFQTQELEFREITTQNIVEVVAQQTHVFYR